MTKRDRGRGRLLPLAVLLCLFLVTPTAAETPASAEYPIDGGAGAMAAGPDGTVWFASSFGGGLGRIKPDGELEIVMDGGSHHFRDLAMGADGSLWAASFRDLARISPAGEVRRFALPPRLGEPSALSAGPGGIWVASWLEQKKVPDWEEWTGPAYVSRVAPDGRIESFELPGEVGARNRPPGGVALGRDGNLWVTDPALGRIHRVSSAGRITSFKLAVSPYSIVAGPGGDLWFAAEDAIGRITPAGKVTAFPLRGSSATNVVAGADGNLWFTGGGSSVGRITPWGQVSSFYVPSQAGTTDLAATADGGIWVGTDAHPVKGIPAGSISKLSITGPGVELASTVATVRNGRFQIELECGGSPAQGCAGEVRLGWGRKAPALGRYAIPPESRRAIQLQLPAAAQRRLVRQRFWREHFSVSVDAGEEAGGEVVLRIPRPLRRDVPPRQVVEIPLPSGFEIGSLARGLGGDFWFADEWGNRINRITPKGKLGSYRLPTPGLRPRGVTPGPRHSMWFFVEGVKHGRKYRPLARLSARGKVTEIPLPGEAYVADLVTGVDGNLWITRHGYDDGEVARVTPQGKVTRFPIVEGAPGGIARGPGGLWFTAEDLMIGRVSLEGKMTKFRVPGRGYLNGFTAGPDGNVWFTHSHRRGPPTVGRITPRGRIAEFPIHRRGHRGSTPGSIVAAPDGNLWFEEYGPPGIGRITPSGKITHFRLPKGVEAPADLTVGPDGNLWFVQWRSNKVGIFGLVG